MSAGHTEERARTIEYCLQLLEAEAREADLEFLAHLIGVAALAVRGTDAELPSA